MLKNFAFLSPVARYSRFVLFGRGFLWVMIAGVISAMIYIASDNSGVESGRVVFSKIKTVIAMQNVMNKPYYQGLDKDNLPYTVIAEKATQQDSDTVLLETIKADMETKDGKWLALQSGEGVLKVKDKQLTLTKNVDMFYDGGYEFRTAEAYVDIRAGAASGDKPVQGQAPMGTLTADSFIVLDRGAVIKFNGSVRVILYRE